MPRTLMSRLSIRLIAPSLLVLPVLLVSLVLITIGSIQGRAAVERLASQQLRQIHDQISRHVDALLSLPARIDQTNVALVEQGRFDPERLRSWAPVLIEQFIAFERLSAITWGSPDGRCTWIARYVGDDEHLYYAIKDEHTGDEIVEHRVDRNGVIAAEPASRFPFDPRERPWYTAPVAAGAPAWSEPFLWVGGGEEDAATLGIAFGWPHYNSSGDLVGVMDADLSLQDISRFLSGLRIGQTGRVFLVDEQGLLLASSTGAAVANDAGERLHAGASDERWIAESFRLVEERSEQSPRRDLVQITTIDGAAEWLRASTIEHHTGLRWRIVTLVPESDFMSEIAAGRKRSAWTTAGVTAATLALGILLSAFLVRPILELSRHVRKLGEGDLDREVQLPYARELVHLSDDINQMTADLRDRLALRRSLAMAMDVQQNLLPSETPNVKGLDIAGHSTYCDETGGDYYDYLEIADIDHTSAALVIGDVMGHGIAAAMLMATARGILRSRCTEPGSLGELLTHLNALLVDVTGGTRFMTMVLLMIDGKSRNLRLASAGHDSPFIYDPEQDAFIELDSTGLPLGIVKDEHYHEIKHEALPLGSVILSSTDGVWEAHNEEQEQYGKDRVCALIRANAHRSSREIAEALRRDVQSFCGEAKQQDDITFVVVKCVDRTP